MQRTLISIVIACTAIAGTARAGHATPHAAAACPSLANVIGFKGHVNMVFSETATGKDPQGGDHLHVSLDRRAIGVVLDLTQKIGNDGTPIAAFIGIAHGGAVKIDDRFRESYPDFSPRYSGTEAFNGALPTKLGAGAAQLYIDRTHCTAKLHVGFIVKAGYVGSKKLQPDPSVGGAFWSDPVRLDASLHVVGGDGPDVLNHGCPGGSPLLSPTSCYLPSGGWTPAFTALRLCHTPSQNHCDVTTLQQIGQASLVWILKPVLAG